MNSPVSQLFDAAYALLDQEGIELRKGTYGGPHDGGYCALGALRMAAFGDVIGDVLSPSWGAYCVAYDAVSRRLQSLEPGSLGYLPVWNDKEERTKADVLALFRQLAAEMAEVSA